MFCGNISEAWREICWKYFGSSLLSLPTCWDSTGDRLLTGVKEMENPHLGTPQGPRKLKQINITRRERMSCQYSIYQHIIKMTFVSFWCVLDFFFVFCFYWRWSYNVLNINLHYHSVEAAVRDLYLIHSFSEQYHLPYILLLVLCPSKNIWKIINPHLSELGIKRLVLFVVLKRYVC
jgi:hypothetical protein